MEEIVAQGAIYQLDHAYNLGNGIYSYKLSACLLRACWTAHYFGVVMIADARRLFSIYYYHYRYYFQIFASRTMSESHLLFDLLENTSEGKFRQILPHVMEVAFMNQITGRRGLACFCKKPESHFFKAFHSKFGMMS